MTPGLEQAVQKTPPRNAPRPLTPHPPAAYAQSFPARDARFWAKSEVGTGRAGPGHLLLPSPPFLSTRWVQPGPASWTLGANGEKKVAAGARAW